MKLKLCLLVVHVPWRLGWPPAISHVVPAPCPGWRSAARRGCSHAPAQPFPGCGEFPLLVASPRSSRLSSESQPARKPSFCEHSSARNPIKAGGSAGRGAGEGLPTPHAGTALSLQIFRAIRSTGESPNVNFHPRCVSMTSRERKEAFPSPGSHEEPEGCLALVVNPQVKQRRGERGTPALATRPVARPARG